MATRNDHATWTPAEDDYLHARLDDGWTARRIFVNWPSQFPRRSTGAINNRKEMKGWRVRKSDSAAAQPEQTVDVTDTGDGITIRAAGTRIRTLDDLLRHVEADLTTFEVDKPTFRKNEVAVRDERGKLNLVEYFHVSCTLRRKAGPNTQEQVEAMIAGAFAKRKPVARKLGKARGDADILQCVSIADPHIGKLSWPTETGSGPWDTPIAVETLREGVTHLMAEGDARGVGERAFCLLGDYLHHDGRGMTTQGTVLDYDSRIKKLMREGTQLLCDVIAASAERVPTRVYVIPGNHDFVLSFALQEVLWREFKKHPRVTVDDRGTSTRFFQWGRCLIGRDHGDKGKKRLPDTMVTACEVEWGETIVREILTGHLHSKAAIDTMGGIVVRTMDSLATADAYHAAEKFNASPRTIEAFRYHKGGMLAGTDSWSPDLNRAPRRGTV